MTDVSCEALGESMLLLRFGHGIDRSINDRVHAAARAIAVAQLRGVLDVVPAYATLAIRFDPGTWVKAGDAAVHPWRRLAAAVESIIDHAPPTGSDDARVIDIAVCYGGEHGIDLAGVAQHAGISESEVIERHCAPVYQVAMLGFAPGFAYLLGLDERLQMPRRAEPRVRVPIGSVAIGGAQTGIYPRELPGGWQLIGRTPAILFDPLRAAPALLAPGDHVRFRAITPAEFARHCHESSAHA